MRELLKYEMKDISRTFITGLILILSLNILVFVGYRYIGGGIFSEVSFKQTEAGFGFNSGTIFGSILGISVVLCFLVNTSIIVVSFLFGINIFKKDLYNDSGVMLMTTPRTGMQIVTAKFLMAIIQFVIAFLVSGFFIIMHIIAIQGMIKGVKVAFFSDILLEATIKRLDLWVLAVITALAVFAWVIMASFLAIAFSKSYFKKKNLRWLITAIVFFALVAVDSFISSFLEKVIPFTYDATGFLSSYSRTIVNDLQLNAASSVFELMFIGLMLFGTAYLLENKVEI